MSAFSDYPDIIDVPTTTVRELPRHMPAAYQPVAPARSSATDIAAMLPAVPQGRDYNHLITAAKAAGARIGSQFDQNGNNRAIYSFPAGGSRVEGATVWLIGALWQEYGHLLVDSQITEEKDGGRVTITTTIVDRVNGTIYKRDHRHTLAPAPRKFAEKVDQVSRWEAMQMQSAISKAERTTVEHFLPAWYVDAAKDAAYDAASSKLLTKRDGSRGTLSEALDAVVGAYKDMGVSLAQLETRAGEEREHWTLTELGELRALYGAIKDGSQSIAIVFPAADAPAVGTRSGAGGLGGLGGDAPAPKRRPAAPAPAKKPAAKPEPERPAAKEEPKPAAPAVKSEAQAIDPWAEAAAFLDAEGYSMSQQASMRRECEDIVKAGQARTLLDAARAVVFADDGVEDAEGMPS